MRMKAILMMDNACVTFEEKEGKEKNPGLYLAGYLAGLFNINQQTTHTQNPIE